MADLSRDRVACGVLLDCESANVLAYWRSVIVRHDSWKYDTLCFVSLTLATGMAESNYFIVYFSYCGLADAKMSSENAVRIFRFYTRGRCCDWYAPRVGDQPYNLHVTVLTKENSQVLKNCDYKYEKLIRYSPGGITAGGKQRLFTKILGRLKH